jgi:RNA polymerase sigma-70 factor (ECF subfamily)
MNGLADIATLGRDSRDDADLVKAIIGGDEACLRVIWDRHVVSVRATLLACLGSDHAIDDLTQEVFLALVRSAARMRDPSALRPYLLGTATRLALFELRTRARRNRWQRLFHFSFDRDEHVCLPDVDARDAIRVLNHVLRSIPARECQAFVLRYVQDLSPSEVAVALGIPKGSAKRAIAVGRKLVLAKAKNDPSLTDYLRRCRETE